MAFPKQITAAFGNTLRPHDLALTETRAGAAAANALANVLPACVGLLLPLSPSLSFSLCACTCLYLKNLNVVSLCFPATFFPGST